MRNNTFLLIILLLLAGCSSSSKINNEAEDQNPFVESFTSPSFYFEVQKDTAGFLMKEFSLKKEYIGKDLRYDFFMPMSGIVEQKIIPYEDKVAVYTRFRNEDPNRGFFINAYEGNNLLYRSPMIGFFEEKNLAELLPKSKGELSYYEPFENLNAGEFFNLSRYFNNLQSATINVLRGNNILMVQKMDSSGEPGGFYISKEWGHESIVSDTLQVECLCKNGVTKITLPIIVTYD